MDMEIATPSLSDVRTPDVSPPQQSPEKSMECCAYGSEWSQSPHEENLEQKAGESKRGTPELVPQNTITVQEEEEEELMAIEKSLPSQNDDDNDDDDGDGEEKEDEFVHGSPGDNGSVATGLETGNTRDLAGSEVAPHQREEGRGLWMGDEGGR